MEVKINICLIKTLDEINIGKIYHVYGKYSYEFYFKAFVFQKLL